MLLPNRREILPKFLCDLEMSLEDPRRPQKNGANIDIAATMWIRDGVLVDRMHINAVAFAYAAYLTLEPARMSASLAELVNFSLAKSGMSCLEKILSLEINASLEDAQVAARFYNQIATEAAASASYFSGALETLCKLKASGTKNFITSAVEQQILDQWLTSKQGLEAAPYLEETLGRRNNFVKGADHFEYVRKIVDWAPIYYIADAEFEIKQAASIKQANNLVPLGFAHCTDSDQIRQAQSLVRTACSVVASQWQFAFLDTIDCNNLILPTQEAIRENLLKAGAVAVVADFAELAEYLF